MTPEQTADLIAAINHCAKELNFTLWLIGLVLIIGVIFK
jgi:hypothetical protein